MKTVEETVENLKELQKDVKSGWAWDSEQVLQLLHETIEVLENIPGPASAE